MKVFAFGNPDLPLDALPLTFLPKLQVMFPDTEFVVLDPNEDWNIPKHMVIIDTVIGIPKVTVFHDLDSFSRSANVSVHDFDAYTNLRFMQKLGKVDQITIIGVPSMGEKSSLLEGVCKELSEIVHHRS